VAVPFAAIVLASLVGVLREDSLTVTPGEVVQSFLRRVLQQRYGMAVSFLASDVQRSATPGALEEWKQRVETGLGKIRGVRGETEWISGETAEASGVLVAKQRDRRLRFALKSARGRWVITRLDEFWGEVAGAEGPIRVREAWRGRPRSANLPRLHSRTH
jgi:hypothetical protein